MTRPRPVAARAGAVSIEAALALCLVLVPLCLGVIGLGMAMQAADRLDRALRAAVFYAWANPGTPSGWGATGSASLAAARAAALAAYGPQAPAAAVTATVAFYCVANGYTKLPPAVAATASCPSGQALGTWLTVAARTAVTPPGMPAASAIPLSVSGTVRVQ